MATFRYFAAKMISHSEESLSSNSITPHQAQIMFVVGCVANSLSIMGSLFNIGTTMFLKTSHRSVERMVIGISLMDLIYNVVCLISSSVQVSDATICQAETFIMMFGYGGSIAWTCCFAHALYISLRASQVLKLEKYVNYYLLISMVVGAVIGTISVLTEFDHIDPGTQTCRYHQYQAGFDWTDLLVIALPINLAVVFCGVCYLSVIKKLREIGARMHLELLLYPLILIICYFPFMVLGFYSTGGSSPYSLMLVSGTLSDLQGLFNGFAYGLSRKIARGYRNRCCKKRVRASMRAASMPFSCSEPLPDSLGSLLVDETIPNTNDKEPKRTESEPVGPKLSTVLKLTTEPQEIVAEKASQ